MLRGGRPHSFHDLALVRYCMFAFNSPSVTEIASDVYRFGLYAREMDLQFFDWVA